MPLERPHHPRCVFVDIDLVDPLRSALMSTMGDEADVRGELRPHHYEFEPPDVLHLHLCGTVELRHARATVRLAEHYAASRGIYLLRDARQAGVIEPAAREHIMKSTRSGTIVATVSYGASFHTRIIVTMVIRAIKAFNNAAPILVFFDTEEQARAWIDNHRAGAVGAAR